MVDPSKAKKRLFPPLPVTTNLVPSQFQAPPITLGVWHAAPPFELGSVTRQSLAPKVGSINEEPAAPRGRGVGLGCTTRSVRPAYWGGAAVSATFTLAISAVA